MSTSQENYQIAVTIKDQIGQHSFVMIGAKQFMVIDNGLQFVIGFNKKKINKIQVILMPDDTYTMRFMQIRKWDIVQDVVVQNVYCDQLNDMIEEYTGMHTSL